MESPFTREIDGETWTSAAALDNAIAIAVHAEREACAKLAENFQPSPVDVKCGSCPSTIVVLDTDTPHDIADAIRARSK